MEFIPIPDNNTKTINKVFEQIHKRISETVAKQKEELSAAITSLNSQGDPSEMEGWQDEWTNAVSDTERLDIIARFLGIL